MRRDSPEVSRTPNVSVGEDKRDLSSNKLLEMLSYLTLRAQHTSGWHNNSTVKFITCLIIVYVKRQTSINDIVTLKRE